MSSPTATAEVEDREERYRVVIGYLNSGLIEFARLAPTPYLRERANHWLEMAHGPEGRREPAAHCEGVEKADTPTIIEGMPDGE